LNNNQKHSAYIEEVPVAKIVRRTGDVAARVAVRFDELQESARLIDRLLATLPAGPYRESVPIPAPGAFGIGLIEGWRGPVLVALETGAAGHDRPLSSARSLVAELAGPRARHHRQHRARLPADQ